MTTYNGRTQVEAGFYLNRKTLHLTTVEKAGALPGTELETYYRVPMLALLAAAPVLGLFYVMFLPFLGFAMVLHLVGTKVAHLVGDAAAHAVRALRPSWAPALAFLTRHTPAEKPEAPAEVPTDTNARDEWKENVEATLRDHDERRS